MRAIRWRWLAATSAVTTLVVLIQLLRVLCTSLEQASIRISWLLVLGAPTLLVTLPETTLRWRLVALLVGFNVGTIVNSPVTTLSPGAYTESLAKVFERGGDGLLVVLVCTLIALPLLEAIGAWVRRHALADEADRRARA